ncbi:hypothetical protein DESA109040_13075 [Deinococcus saxicola]|uniref:hypothetical protein n=1 Tax=Deinococcus saxicola TaxID=249406 RepID=UPI0039F10BBD
MNSVINMGGAGLSFGVLAAGLLLAYGLWQGRRDLGMRAAWGILGATILAGILPSLLFFLPPGPRLGGALPLLILQVVGTLLAFLPLYVAANWLEVIREATGQAGGS